MKCRASCRAVVTWCDSWLRQCTDVGDDWTAVRTQQVSQRGDIRNMFITWRPDLGIVTWLALGPVYKQFHVHTYGSHTWRWQRDWGVLSLFGCSSYIHVYYIHAHCLSRLPLFCMKACYSRRCEILPSVHNPDNSTNQSTNVEIQWTNHEFSVSYETILYASVLSSLFWYPFILISNRLHDIRYRCEIKTNFLCPFYEYLANFDTSNWETVNAAILC